MGIVLEPYFDSGRLEPVPHHDFLFDELGEVLALEFSHFVRVLEFSLHESEEALPVVKAVLCGRSDGRMLTDIAEGVFLQHPGHHD